MEEGVGGGPFQGLITMLKAGTLKVRVLGVLSRSGCSGAPLSPDPLAVAVITAR